MSTDDFSMAHHLIEISLDKIGQSRFGRGGISLHKNLLVATVLQKARFIFMEGYNLAHLRHLKACCRSIRNDLNDIQIEITAENDNCSINLTTDYNDTNSSNNVSNSLNNEDEADSTDTELEALLAYSCNNNNGSAYEYSDISTDNSKNNTSTTANNKNIILDSPLITSSPRTSPPMNSLTYFDLDKNRTKNNNTGIKRRRNELTTDLDESDEEQDIQSETHGVAKSEVAVDEIEVEDSVVKIISCTVSQSKRIKIHNQKNTAEVEANKHTEHKINSLHSNDNENNSNCSSIISNNISLSINDNDNNSSICNLVDLSYEKFTTTVNDNNTINCHNEDKNNNSNVIVDEEVETPMEIDKITSLVSIFSFGNLSRTVSTPDLCSAQAKDAEINNNNCLTQQRTFLTMTV